MRLKTSLAIATAALLSATAFGAEKNSDAAKPGAKQGAAPAVNESTINLKVTGMT